MRFSRFFQAFETYGVAGCLGKALMLMMLFAAPLRAGDVTVLALGDSLTQGYGLPEGQGLVPQLRAWLEEKGVDAHVINGGVSGDTTAGGAARVGWSLTDDVDAMIVTLGGNDLLRAIDPGVSRANLERVLQEAQARNVEVLLVGMRAPGNYGPDYTAAFNAIYPDLAQAYDVLLHPDFFSGLGGGTPDRLRAFFQPDGIHPNRQGVEGIVAGLGPSVLALMERADDPAQ